MFRRHLATSPVDAYNIHFYNRGNLVRCKESLPISDFLVASDFCGVVLEALSFPDILDESGFRK